LTSVPARRLTEQSCFPSVHWRDDGAEQLLGAELPVDMSPASSITPIARQYVVSRLMAASSKQMPSSSRWALDGDSDRMAGPGVAVAGAALCIVPHRHRRLRAGGCRGRARRGARGALGRPGIWPANQCGCTPTTAAAGRVAAIADAVVALGAGDRDCPAPPRRPSPACHQSAHDLPHPAGGA
jgi:hypothetical protein